MASLSIGFLEAELLYPREWYRKQTAPGVHGLAEVDCKQSNSFFRARDWDQLEGMAETLVVSDSRGVDGWGRWGQGSGQ